MTRCILSFATESLAERASYIDALTASGLSAYFGSDSGAGTADYVVVRRDTKATTVQWTTHEPPTKLSAAIGPEDLARFLRTAVQLRDCRKSARAPADDEPAELARCIVAHDANNLLTSMTFAAELLAAPEAPVAQLAAEILEGCTRLKAMIRHVTGSNGSRRQRSVSVNDIIAPLVPALRSLGANQRTLTTRLEPQLPPVQIHPVDLERAVLNLVANARDATPEGGRISLSTSSVSVDASDSAGVPRGRWVVVEVTDHGSGMDEPTVARAFEPYFTTKPPDRGTGLGLTSVLLVIRAAGGHVRIRSKPGEGTCVQLWLPVLGVAALEESLSFG